MNTNNEIESESAADDAEAKESATNANEAAENDSSLQALVSEEQSLARRRFREETGREPTEREADKWLSEQTEGY